jgi:dienelactone hydrolase
MTEVVLFHHAQGQTPGFQKFADDLRAAGHVVHAPDLYEGKTFADLTDGVDYAEQVGFDAIVERGARAAEGLPLDVVYAGFSLGTLPAQMLTQTRRGARGALLLHGCMPTAEFATRWPEHVPVQIHSMDGDAWFELDVARELVNEIDDAELFLYPGDRHLFADSSLGEFDAEAAALLTERVRTFLRCVANVRPGPRRPPPT